MYYYVIPNLLKYIKFSLPLNNETSIIHNNKYINNSNFILFSKNEIEEIIKIFLNYELIDYVYIISDNKILYNLFTNKIILTNINSKFEKKTFIIIDKFYENNLQLLIDIFSSILIQQNESNLLFKLYNLPNEIINNVLFIISGYYEKLILINSNIDNVYYIMCKNCILQNKNVIYNTIQNIKNNNKIIRYNLPQYFIDKLNEYKITIKTII